MAATGGAIRNSINDINAASQAFINSAKDIAESFARQASTVIGELAEAVDTEVAQRADPAAEVQRVEQHLHHHINEIRARIHREVSQLLAVLDG